MKFWEAIKALEEGKKVRSKKWIGEGLYVDKLKEICFRNGSCTKSLNSRLNSCK